MTVPAPLPDSYWVLPGQLLAGPYAGSRDVTQAQLRLDALLTAGVRRLINLTQVDEIGSGGPLIPYERALYDLAKAGGVDVSYHRLPMTEGTVPTQARMHAILSTVRAGLIAGEAVYVHCRAGRGRTGTVVGCLLVENGTPRGAVLDEIAALRRETATPGMNSPEPGVQSQMVNGGAARQPARTVWGRAQPRSPEARRNPCVEPAATRQLLGS